MSQWKRLKREKVYSSKFLNVYEDEVILPNGKILDDYTVVEKPDIVMIVATDQSGSLIVLNEYKYAAGQDMLTIPAGHKNHGESPVNAAKRELLEETGYAGEKFEEICTIFDYPSKDSHKVHIVRAQDVIKHQETQHEHTESIKYSLVSVDKIKTQIKEGKWKTSSAIAAISISGLLF